MGRPFSAVGNFFCCLFFYVPGVKHALVCYADRKVDKSVNKITKAINNPTYTRALKEQGEGRVRGKRIAIPIIAEYDDPHVGQHGTKFRSR